MSRSTFEEQLEKNGEIVYTTVGVSMEPLLHERKTLVRIKKTENRPKLLDMPLYKRANGQYVLHRVYAVHDGYYSICGDNLISFERVPEEAILGVVTEYYRNGKWHSVEDVPYRLYAILWFVLYPVRYVYRKLRNWAAKQYHKIIK